MTIMAQLSWPKTSIEQNLFKDHIVLIKNNFKVHCVDLLLQFNLILYEMNTIFIDIFTIFQVFNKKMLIKFGRLKNYS